MEIIRDSKALTAAIHKVGKTLRKAQDVVHELVVSAMFHFYEHGDSQHLTQLCAEVTKCHGTNKKKLIGYCETTCGINWDNQNIRFKKSKGNTFTKESGNPFPLERLTNERWYEFELAGVDTAWLLKQALKSARTKIENHSDEAIEQVEDAWQEFQALQETLRDIGFGDSEESWGDTPDFIAKKAA